MSARDWQPGDKALIEVEFFARNTPFDWVSVGLPGGGMGKVQPSSALRPVPAAGEAATEDVVERAAEVMWDATCDDGMRAAMRPDLMAMARALAAANLLASPDAIRQAKAEALREFADTRGVNVGDEDDEWWSGYRQAQRECLHAAAAAADRIGGE